MYYLEWNENSIKGLDGYDGCVVLFTEVSATGVVQKELGFDSQGNECHRFPSKTNKRVIFDNQLVDVTRLQSDLSKEFYIEMWDKASL